MRELIGVAQVELREAVGGAHDVPQGAPRSRVRRRRANRFAITAGDLQDRQQGTVGVGHALRELHGIRPLHPHRLLELGEQGVCFGEP